LTKPLNIDQSMSNDPCFGKLWAPQDSECAICHAIEMCGIIYQDTILKKKKAFEKEKGPTLDQAQYEHVDFASIVKAIEKGINKGKTYSFDDLVYTIGELAKSKDTQATKEYLKRMLPKYNMTINEGRIVFYDKGTDNYQEPGRLTK